jgi:hypothetical protein
VAQFDFSKRTLSLTVNTVYKPMEDQLIATLPMKEVQGAIACEGSVDGEPATILLDVAGDFEFATMEPPDEEIRQVSLGDLVFRQVKAESSYERGMGLAKYPRIGRQLLSRFKVTFDFKKKLIYVEKPDA